MSLTEAYRVKSIEGDYENPHENQTIEEFSPEKEIDKPIDPIISSVGGSSTATPVISTTSNLFDQYSSLFINTDDLEVDALVEMMFTPVIEHPIANKSSNNKTRRKSSESSELRSLRFDEQTKGLMHIEDTSKEGDQSPRYQSNRAAAIIAKTKLLEKTLKGNLSVDTEQSGYTSNGTKEGLSPKFKKVKVILTPFKIRNELNI